MVDAPPAPVKKKEEPVVQAPVVEPVVEKQPEQELIKAKADELKGLKVIGRIEVPAEKKKEAPAAQQGNQDDRKGKRPRKRIATDQGQAPQQQGTGQGQQRGPRPPQQQRLRQVQRDAVLLGRPGAVGPSPVTRGTPRGENRLHQRRPRRSSCPLRSTDVLSDRGREI